MKDNSVITILVIGGMGFLGTHLVRSLLDQGYRVRCFDLPRLNEASSSSFVDDKLELFYGDFSHPADVRAAALGCQICYHLVSTTTPQSSNLDPSHDVATNVIATLNLLVELVKTEVKKVIFISSGGTVYGNPQMTPISETHPTEPVCSYGIVKLAIEKYLFLYHKLYDLKFVILRLANPYGEGQPLRANQGAVAVFLNRYLAGKEIEIWGDGTVVRDYVYITDVVDALLMSLKYEGADRIFNIGSGVGLSVNDILDAIDQLDVIKTNRKYLAGRTFDVSANILNISKANLLLGWQPKILFRHGLQKHYRSLLK